MRFIPTHVGNSRQRSDRVGRIPVHPHARGEQGGLRHGVLLGSRFIPTHVGNREMWFEMAEWLSVHPHARGEQAVLDDDYRNFSGSSPRTWGTEAGMGQGIQWSRFIPTHVGNRNGTASAARAASVHPHARGEQRSKPVRMWPYAGSSPRTWGTVASHLVDRRSDRFIPTHVGNRCATSSSASWSTVHPHARGEQTCCASTAVEDHGSSPRTWGTELQALAHALHGRFIPTHVGNRRTSGTGSAARPVHPHARGEQQDHLYQSQLDLRFIPTHVGNSPPRPAPGT